MSKTLMDFVETRVEYQYNFDEEKHNRYIVGYVANKNVDFLGAQLNFTLYDRVLWSEGTDYGKAEQFLKESMRMKLKAFLLGDFLGDPDE